MATARLIPSSYATSNSSYATVYSGEDNMYNNTSNTSNYASLRGRNRNSTTAYYIFIKGFNFGTIPSNANVSSFKVMIRCYRNSYQRTGNAYRLRLASTTNINNVIANTTTSTEINTTASVIEIPTGNLTWSTLSNYGADFSIVVPLSSTSSSRPYVYVYGAEIEVTYSLGTPRTITSTLTGNGTIDPSGAETHYDGETYELMIVPTNASDTVTATKNGTAITLTEHTSSESISATADSLTTGFSGGSNMAFYTSSSSTGHNFNYAIGHTAASPGSTSSGSGSWTYVKENGSSTNNTGYADFVFDFSSIPVGSTINSVTVQCYGATESTSESTAHSEITLYSGTTLKSTSQKFTSTSNTTITISSPGTWTRDELQSAKLRFVVGYYGGHIFGITWTVNFTPPKYYTYSYTVSGDATIAVTIGGGSSTPKFYVKVNGTWTQVSKIYKKVNGSWVEQSSSTWSTLFDTNTNYRKMN